MATAKYDDYFNKLGIDSPERKLQFCTKLKQDIESELLSLPESVHSVIISSEHFHSRTTTLPEVQNVHDLLSPFFANIKVICYLREQSATCTSLYSTVIKGGSQNTQAFEKLKSGCNPNNIYYNYYNMLANWGEVFGTENLVVRRYDKRNFVNGDLIDDFFSILDTSLVSMLDRETDTTNQSLNPFGQIVGLAINKSMPVHENDEVMNRVRNRTFHKLYATFKGDGRALSKEDYKAIYDSFAESNTKLNQAYFGVNQNFFEYREPKENSALELDDSLSDYLAVVLSELNRNMIGLREDQGVFLRDVALALGKENQVHRAYGMMRLATSILPQDKVVSEKLEEYRLRVEKLGQQRNVLFSARRIVSSLFNRLKWFRL